MNRKVVKKRAFYYFIVCLNLVKLKDELSKKESEQGQIFVFFYIFLHKSAIFVPFFFFKIVFVKAIKKKYKMK